MVCFKWWKKSTKKSVEAENLLEVIDGEEEQRPDDEAQPVAGTKIIYIAFDKAKQNVIDLLKTLEPDVEVRLEVEKQFQICVDLYFRPF